MYVGPLTGLDHKAVCNTIIQSYLDGKDIKTIAMDLGGVSTERLYQVLTTHAEEDWKQAQTAKALAEYEKAKHGLGCARDKISLARASVQVRTAQWELERVCRRIYGQEAAQVLGSGMVQININVGPGGTSQVIDGDALGQS